jgi:hypothetical protein
VRAKGIPYLLGEFGDNTPNIPWKYTMRFLEENDIDFTYWCCDGFQCERTRDETYGLYTNDFCQVRNKELYDDLCRVICKK